MLRSQLYEDSLITDGDGLCDFDMTELDADMAEFREQLSIYTEADGKDLFFGISPTHSSDSGVDNIEEDMFDFESNSCYSQHSLGSFDGNSSDEVKKDGAWMTSKPTKSPMRSRILTSERSKLEMAIEEDHCYTSKEMPASECEVTGKLGSSLVTGKNVNLSNQVVAARMEEIPEKSGMEDMRKPVKEISEYVEKIVVEDASDKCNNRNAVMARLNRQRKKRYVNNLESEVRSLRKQNTTLLADNQDLNLCISKCREELAYLKNVLENQSMLSSVINAVSKVPGVKLRGVVDASSANTDGGRKGSYQLSQGKANSKEDDGDDSCEGLSTVGSLVKTGGVCLHVKQENVSVEFCHYCSNHAMSNK